MKRTFAACLAAALLVGGAGTALAQERGNQGYGQGSHYGNANRGGNKATHNNRGGNRAHNPGHNNRNAYKGNSHGGNTYRGNANRYSYGNPRTNDPRTYNSPYRTYGNQYRHVRVYPGQVYRPYYGWQPVPSAYARNLNHRPGYRYYRSGNDIVLVAIATGIVVNVLANAIR